MAPFSQNQPDGAERTIFFFSPKSILLHASINSWHCKSSSHTCQTELSETSVTPPSVENTLLLISKPTVFVEAR